MKVEYLRISSGQIFEFNRILTESEVTQFQNGNDLDGIYLRNLGDEFELEEYKEKRYVEIDAKTESIIARGFVFDNKTFSLSANAQINLLGLQLNKAVLTYPLKWTTKNDKSFYMINNVDEANSFHLTALGTKDAHLRAGEVLKDAVRVATTKEEVDLVVDNR